MPKTPRTPKAPPSSVQVLTHYLTAGLTEYIEVTLKSYFSNPADPEAREILLRATANALSEVTKNDPTHRATLRTFALELLEQE